MGQIFQVDGPLYKFMLRIVDIMVLNFWLLVCSIPIITIGASLSAAFSVGMKMIQEQEGYITQSFFREFKKNWKQGTIIWLQMLVVAYVIYLDFAVYFAIDSRPMPLLIIGVLAGFYFFFSFLYAIPLSVRYENTIKNIRNNSMSISTRYMLRTFLLLIMIAIEVILFLYNSTTLFFGIVMGIAFIVVTMSWMCVEIFHDIEKKSASAC